MKLDRAIGISHRWRSHRIRAEAGNGEAGRLLDGARIRIADKKRLRLNRGRREKQKGEQRSHLYLSV
jgi:hypothetical protein